jgi:hypothetical protein
LRRFAGGGLLASAASTEGSVAVIESVMMLLLPLSDMAVEVMVSEGVEAAVVQAVVACPPKMVLLFRVAPNRAFVET